MGLQEASANLDAKIAESSTEDTSSEVDTSVDVGSESEGDSSTEAGESEKAAIQAIIDLDAAQKFKFQGQEWTPEELHKSILRQKDYTKKTSEIASERRYMSNLQTDLAAVKRDPTLADQFRKIYPDAYHTYLDLVLEQLDQNQNSGLQNGQANQTQLSPELMKRLSALEANFSTTEKRLKEADQKAYEAEVASQEQHLDQLFGKLSQKYEFGVEEAVMTKAEALIGKGYQMTDAAWERLWKANHDAHLAKVEKWNAAKVKNQLQKSKEGSDIGRGGAAPGQGRKRMTFDEATEAAIASLSKAG